MTILPNFTYLCKPLCERLELMTYIVDFIKWNQIVPYIYSRRYQQLVTNINTTSCNIQITVFTLKKNHDRKINGYQDIFPNPKSLHYLRYRMKHQF